MQAVEYTIDPSVCGSWSSNGTTTFVDVSLKVLVNPYVATQVYDVGCDYATLIEAKRFDDSASDGVVVDSESTISQVGQLKLDFR